MTTVLKFTHVMTIFSKEVSSKMGKGIQINNDSDKLRLAPVSSDKIFILIILFDKSTKIKLK